MAHPRATHIATDPVALAARLSRGAATRNARVVCEAAVPFGTALRLHRYRFGNGLTLLALADPSTPLLSYHTWYGVGSRHEKKGKTGLAHLFEHLMFNETKNLKKGEFDRRIEAAGAETNASTWTDWTHYQTELPATEFGVIVPLEADRMQNLVLREPQVRSEKVVVANERLLRVDDDVEGEVSERMYQLAFRRHPYGHPTIGWMKDIKAFTTADCRKFYKTYYAPNNATIVIVGNFDETRALRLVQKHYGGIRAAKIPSPAAITEAPQRAERKLVMRRSTPTEKLALGYHAPAFGDADYPALSLINELLFNGRSARLYQRLVQKEQLATEVHAGIAPFAEAGLFDIWVSLRPGRRVKEALRSLDAELKRICEQRVSEKDLERVKSRSELGFLLALETAGGKAEQVGFYEVVIGDGARVFSRLDEFRAVTADDVMRVARRVFNRKRRTRIDVLPRALSAKAKNVKAGAES